MEESSRTLRGFLAGSESAEETFLPIPPRSRIFGDIPNLGEISARLGLKPTNTHRKGCNSPTPRHSGFRSSMWAYDPPVEKSEPLEKHINALWEKLEPHKQYLLELKKSLSVDVFLGYRSNCDHAGIQVRERVPRHVHGVGDPLWSVDHHHLGGSADGAPSAFAGEGARAT